MHDLVIFLNNLKTFNHSEVLKMKVCVAFANYSFQTILKHGCFAFPAAMKFQAFVFFAKFCRQLGIVKIFALH